MIIHTPFVLIIMPFGDICPQTLATFPFLKDSTSSDYIQARVKVEQTLVDLGIKTSLHELAWKRLKNLALGDDARWYEGLLESFAIIHRRITMSNE